MADGRPATREIIEHLGAVGILAWDGARLALVRQWRQAAGRETLEIPAGTRDPGEEPRGTAERELAEECGVSRGTWEAGPGFWTAPGFCTEYLDPVAGHRPVPGGRLRPGGRGAGAGVAPLDDVLAAVASRARSATRSRWSGSTGSRRMRRAWEAPMRRPPPEPRVLGPPGMRPRLAMGLPSISFRSPVKSMGLASEMAEPTANESTGAPASLNTPIRSASSPPETTIFTWRCPAMSSRARTSFEVGVTRPAPRACPGGRPTAGRRGRRPRGAPPPPRP